MLFRQGAAAQGLTPRRLHLDNVGAALRQQKRRVGALKNLPEIDDREAREGQPPGFRPDARHRALAPAAPIVPGDMQPMQGGPGSRRTIKRSLYVSIYGAGAIVPRRSAVISPHAPIRSPSDRKSTRLN